VEIHASQRVRLIPVLLDILFEIEGSNEEAKDAKGRVLEIRTSGIISSREPELIWLYFGNEVGWVDALQINPLIAPGKEVDQLSCMEQTEMLEAHRLVVGKTKHICVGVRGEVDS